MKKKIAKEDVIKFIDLEFFKEWYEATIEKEDEKEISNLIARASSEIIAQCNTKYNIVDDFKIGVIPESDNYFIQIAAVEISAKFFDMGVDKASSSTSTSFGSKSMSFSILDDNTLQERVYNLLAKTRYYRSEFFVFDEDEDEDEENGNSNAEQFKTGEYLSEVSIKKGDRESNNLFLMTETEIDKAIIENPSEHKYDELKKRTIIKSISDIAKAASKQLQKIKKNTAAIKLIASKQIMGTAATVVSQGGYISFYGTTILPSVVLIQSQKSVLEQIDSKTYIVRAGVDRTQLLFGATIPVFHPQSGFYNFTLLKDGKKFKQTTKRIDVSPGEDHINIGVYFPAFEIIDDGQDHSYQLEATAPTKEQCIFYEYYISVKLYGTQLSIEEQKKYVDDLIKVISDKVDKNTEAIKKKVNSINGAVDFDGTTIIEKNGKISAISEQINEEELKKKVSVEPIEGEVVYENKYIKVVQEVYDSTGSEIKTWNKTSGRLMKKVRSSESGKFEMYYDLKSENMMLISFDFVNYYGEKTSKYNLSNQDDFKKSHLMILKLKHSINKTKPTDDELVEELMEIQDKDDIILKKYFDKMEKREEEKNGTRK